MELILETSDVTVFAECVSRRGQSEIHLRMEPKVKTEPVHTTAALCGTHDLAGFQRTLKELGGKRDGPKQIPWACEFLMRTALPEGIAEELFTVDCDPGKVVLRYDTELIDPQTGKTLRRTHCRTTTTYEDMKKMTRRLIAIMDRCCRGQ